MSKIRKMDSAYKQAAPKGPNGENLCRWCKKEVKPPKRTFCGEECIHEWQLRTSPSYVRTCLKRRDKCICKLCNLDCKQLQQSLATLYNTDHDAWIKEIEKLAIPKGRQRKSLWDADHIVPVCEGGGETGLDNFRTLCIWCHRAETRALRARRAKSRPT